MKMAPKDFEQLKGIIPFDTQERRAQYIAGNFPRADLCKDVDKRYRWDLFYAMPKSPGFVHALYEYLNDAHIDTALRAIIPPLEKKE